MNKFLPIAVLFLLSGLQSSRATITIYRYGGLITSFVDPIYDVDFPVTDGSVTAGQRFTGTFTINSESPSYFLSEPYQLSLNLGHYQFKGMPNVYYRVPNEAQILALGLASDDIVHPIPQTPQNRMELTLRANDLDLNRVFSGQSLSLGPASLVGSSLYLQLMWRDTWAFGQSLAVHSNIDRIETVPEPTNLLTSGLFGFVLFRRRRNHVSVSELDNTSG